MPVSVSVTPRKIYIEDLDLSTAATAQTTTVNVLGAGTNPQTVTKVDMVRLTQFISAANDTAAAAAGVSVGAIYYNTTISNLAARLT